MLNKVDFLANCWLWVDVGGLRVGMNSETSLDAAYCWFRGYVRGLRVGISSKIPVRYK